MYSKYNEIESVIEDLVDNVIVDTFQSCFSNKKECKLALKLLLEKLDDFDESVFDDLFDN